MRVHAFADIQGNRHEPDRSDWEKRQLPNKFTFPCFRGVVTSIEQRGGGRTGAYERPRRCALASSFPRPPSPSGLAGFFLQNLGNPAMMRATARSGLAHAVGVILAH